MSRRSWWRVAPLVVGSFAMTGCIDELSEIFTIILFSESDDPDTRETGKVLAELKVADEGRRLLGEFLDTGDELFLDQALDVRPDDTEAWGFKVALATLRGDPAEIEAAKKSLLLAESRRLASFRDPGDPPTSAEMLRRNALGETLVAQTQLLGGTLNAPWDPPGDDAPPEQQQLFADYCATKAEIQRDFADDLSYIETPDCP